MWDTYADFERVQKTPLAFSRATSIYVYMYIIGYADIQFLRFMVYFMSRASPERKQIHSIFNLGATITLARRAMCLDTILNESNLKIDKSNILNDG